MHFLAFSVFCVKIKYTYYTHVNMLTGACVNNVGLFFAWIDFTFNQ